MDAYRPIILTRKNADEERAFSKFCAENGIVRFVDEIAEAAQELAALRDPALVFTKRAPIESKKEDGAWACFPWKGTAVHILDRGDYDAVRLSRNNDLLTKEEQKTLRTKRIVIAGLNVGNPAAICMVQEGIGAHFRFADNDALGLSNLNRFRAGLTDIGVNKAVLSARQAFEIDPYVDIEVYPNGVSEENLPEFLAGADLLVEEMDHLGLKIRIREEAKKRGIPTVMITGNGAGVVLDIERYDEEPALAPLSGHLKSEVIDAVRKGVSTPEERLRLARDFMGEETLTKRLNESFAKVGKSLIGIPQLAEASFLRGAVLGNAVKNILLGADIRSGRYAFQLDTLWGG